MSTHQPTKSVIPEDFSLIPTHAIECVRAMAETTGFSLLQLTAMFRMAASICDEHIQMGERAEMAVRLRAMYGRRP